MINIIVKDDFSGAHSSKTVKNKKMTFEDAKRFLGNRFNEFSNQINWEWLVVGIEEVDAQGKIIKSETYLKSR